MTKGKNYRVSGMKFPPQVNPATGRFELTEDKECIKQSIYLILMTHKRERIIRPDFGTDILNFIFLENNSTMLNIMISDLEKDIIKNEPRVENVKVEFDNMTEEGKMYINIDYTISSIGEDDSVTFVL